jgi:hypothetical protein
MAVGHDHGVEDLLVHGHPLAAARLDTLPSQYSPFKISYNTQKATWTVAELISYCVEEEERQKAERMKDAVNMVSQRFERVNVSNPPRHQAESGSSKQHKKKKFAKSNANKTVPHKKAQDEKLCRFCKSPKHLMKECAGFKEWLKNKGIDYVSFIDESFLVNFSPNT